MILAWLSANWVTLVVLAVLILIVSAIIYGMIRERRAGKSSSFGCSGDCAHCGHAAEHGMLPQKKT